MYDNVQRRMKIVQKKQEEYEVMREGKDLFDAADLIVENKLLIDKVDELLREEQCFSKEESNDKNNTSL